MKNREVLSVKEEGDLRNKVVDAYQKACLLFKQGDFEEAIDKYNQVISLAGNWPYDDMISRAANAALKQKMKCQFRLLKL